MQSPKLKCLLHSSSKNWLLTALRVLGCKRTRTADSFGSLDYARVLIDATYRPRTPSSYLLRMFAYALEQISTFHTKTSQVLRSALEDKTSAANDYVNILQWLITNSTQPDAEDTFLRDTKETCKIYGNVTNSHLLSRVENLIKTSVFGIIILLFAVLTVFISASKRNVPRQCSSGQMHRTEDADRGTHTYVSLLIPFNTKQKIDNIGEYRTSQEQFDEKFFSLLRRKVSKVDNSLMQDIETLKREVDMVPSFGD